MTRNGRRVNEANGIAIYLSTRNADAQSCPLCARIRQDAPEQMGFISARCRYRRADRFKLVSQREPSAISLSPFGSVFRFSE